MLPERFNTIKSSICSLIYINVYLSHKKKFEEVGENVQISFSDKIKVKAKTQSHSQQQKKISMVVFKVTSYGMSRFCSQKKNATKINIHGKNSLVQETIR